MRLTHLKDCICLVPLPQLICTLDRCVGGWDGFRSMLERSFVKGPAIIAPYIKEIFNFKDIRSMESFSLPPPPPGCVPSYVFCSLLISNLKISLVHANVQVQSMYTQAYCPFIVALHLFKGHCRLNWIFIFIISIVYAFYYCLYIWVFQLPPGWGKGNRSFNSIHGSRIGCWSRHCIRHNWCWWQY